jgi:hypothetical protein
MDSQWHAQAGKFYAGLQKELAMRENVDFPLQHAKLFIKTVSRCLRDSEEIDCSKIALGFRLDWVGSIEQNRRHSNATLRIL